MMYNNLMKIIEKLKNTVKKYSMLSQGNRIVVGLSGGPDSVCLLTILNSLKTDYGIVLFAAYIDHGLRPDETPGEIDFCRDLCKSLEVLLEIRAIDVKSYVKKEGLNKQEAARELRYEALNKIASELNADRIALGHNADDQAETVLMRLIRGAGPSGLAGIPPVRGQIIRPLIDIERSEIEDFLFQPSLFKLQPSGQPFVTDSSNLKDDYLRNKIRLFLMPVIRKINSDVVKTISRTADILRDEERYFDIKVTKLLMKLISRKSDEKIELFLRSLEAMETVLLRRVLRRAVDETKGLRGTSFANIDDIMGLVKSGKSGDRIYLPNGIRAIKGYSTLVLTSALPVRLGTYILDGPGDTVIRETSIVIRSEIIEGPVEDIGDDKKIIFINGDRVHFPLTIRPRKPGDFFYPSGFGKRKKIQDHFVDKKIPRDERDAIPLLTFKNDIIWVVGSRSDERYRVEKETGKILKFEIKPYKS